MMIISKPHRFALVLALLLAGPAAQAQTTLATITGSVADPTGAAIAGATVEATHLATGYRYQAVSNELGQYTLSQLREGEYEVRARAAGFKEFVVREVRLVSRDLRRIDFRLELGTVETSVEVTAGATLIETETARIGDTRGAQVFKDLPLSSRGLSDWLALSPTVGYASTTDAQRRFGGARANQWDGQLDGISFADGRGGNTIGPLMGYIESFQEVRVDIANNSAEFGPIGLVTIVSKSGSNQFHGSAFDYYVTPWFMARNPFATERPTGIRHWPGFTAGGPVRLPRLYNGVNRTFFFFSLETSRGSAAQDLLNPTVPLPDWRKGDFSATTPAVTVRDPFAGNAPFPGNRIPASRINTVSQRIQERFYPLPNFGDTRVLQSQNYRELKIRAFQPNTYWTLRIDHRFSDRIFVFGRFTWNRSRGNSFEGNLPTIGQLWNQRDTRGAVFSYTHSLRSNLLNEFRWGLAFNDNPRHGPVRGLELVRELGLVGLAPDLPDINGILKVSWSGIGLTGISQTDWRHPGYYNLTQQFQDHLSWFRGRHNFKAGAVIGRVAYKDKQAPAALFGQVWFSNRFTGHPYADFLLGIPTQAARAFPPLLIDQWRWAWAGFITDQFKFTNKLTLDIGLRYELRPSWTERENRQAIFDVGTGKIVIPNGSRAKLSPLLPRDYVEVIEAGELNLSPRRLLQTDRNNFAPRLGLAYRPWGNRTVFRGGYGIFYDTVPPGVTVAGVPFRINEPNFTNPTPLPTVVFPRVFPEAVAGPSTVSLPGATRTDLRTPYSMQWNLTLEHERWNTGFRLSYIGTNTRHGEWAYDINSPVADTRAYVDKPRLFPRYPAISYLTNGAGHQYHSLTAEAERQMASGLFFQASWVWARDIGDLERSQSPEYAYDRKRERAVWPDIPTHRITSAAVYQLPLGRGKRFGSRAGKALDAVIGGWQISGMFYYDSGQFLTPQWTGPDPTGTRYTATRTPAQVTLRPNVLRNPNFPRDQRSPVRWFDASAFEPPWPGCFGTSAKGIIYGPGSSVLHAGIYKIVAFGERVRLRWELTATNVANHPNWSNPATNISAPAQVGVVDGVGGAKYDEAGPRSFRAAVRLEW